MSEKSILVILLIVTTALVVALALAWRYSKIRTLKEFSAWAGGVQSIALTIAVCVGGAWALAVFLALQEARAADEDLNDRLSRRTAIEMSFDVADLSATGSKMKDLVITTRLKNAGSRALQVNLSNATICIRPAAARCTGAFVYRLSSLNGGNEAAAHLLIAPGVTRALPVHWQAPDPGVYLVRFDSPIPIAAQGTDKARVTRYRGWSFFSVPVVSPYPTSMPSVP
jgi:hypothetical protein